jgi:hypothetical protein
MDGRDSGLTYRAPLAEIGLEHLLVCVGRDSANEELLLPRHGLPVKALGHLRRDSNSQFQTLLKPGCKILVIYGIWGA